VTTRGTGALRPLLTALPGVALGIAGLWHPAHLNPGTAHQWWVLHVVGMFVFPLVGLAVASLVWPRRSVLPVVVVVGAFLFGTAYNALDILSGMAAGWLTDEIGGSTRPRAVSLIFRLGNPLGEIGAWALVVAALALAVDAWRRTGVRGVAGALVVLVGALLVEEFHIYPPWGSLGIALVGVGSGVVAWAGQRTARSTA
jgi:hypothetical protein